VTGIILCCRCPPNYKICVVLQSITTMTAWWLELVGLDYVLLWDVPRLDSRRLV